MIGEIQWSRRSVLKSVGAVGLAATGTISAGAHVQTISGSVFHDAPASSLHSRRTPGIEGVLVSNGVDVVKTGRDGRFELPHSGEGHVFVITPAGWAKPATTPGPPALPVSACIEPQTTFDFSLVSAPREDRFDVALLADTQPQTTRELDYLRDTILTSVSSSGASFAINHGDIVFDAPELYPSYLELLGSTGMPWHHCPGNHDMDHSPDPMQCFSTWKRVFGPTHYAFQHGQVTFIVLNNVERLSQNVLTSSGHSYRGAIGARQLAFVRNLLTHIPRDNLIVMSMHIPLVGFEDPNDPAGRTADCKELLALLSGRPHTVSFAGHTHTTEHHYLGRDLNFDGPGLHHHHVLTAASGSWWSGPYDACGMPIAESRDGTPKGFHMLSIDGNRYTTRFVPVGHTGDASMRISIQGLGHVTGDGAEPPEVHNAALSVEQLGKASIIVNVFDGGPRTVVSCEIIGRHVARDSDKGRVFALERCSVSDPSTVQNYVRFAADLKPWVCASTSSHIWRAPIGCALSCGSYRIVVTVTDEYGRQHKGVKLVQVM